MVETKQQESKKNKAQQSSHGVGALLRASRSRLGEDLRHVAQSLRIRLVYLEAIEESRFADLPGPTYAVGFVRAYSEYLGLDGDEVVRRFKEEYAEAEKRPDLVFPVPVPERSLPTGAILLLSALLALAAYGGWYVIAGDEQDAELVPTLPQRLQSLLPGGNEAVEKTEEDEAQEETVVETVIEKAEETAEMAAQEAEQVEEEAVEKAEEVVEKTEEAVEEASEDAVEKVEKVVEETAAVTESAEPQAAESHPAQTAEAPKKDEVEQPEQAEPATEQNTQEITESQEPANEAEADAPAAEALVETAQPEAQETANESGNEATTETANEAASEEAATPVADPGPSRIEVRASQPSWIQVRDEVANTMLVTRLLRPGDAYHVPNRKGLTLLTGNAGALEILVDGEKAPTIGELGAIRRKVILEPEKLMDGTAANE